MVENNFHEEYHGGVERMSAEEDKHAASTRLPLLNWPEIYKTGKRMNNGSRRPGTPRRLKRIEDNLHGWR